MPSGVHLPPRPVGSCWVLRWRSRVYVAIAISDDGHWLTLDRSRPDTDESLQRAERHVERCNGNRDRWLAARVPRDGGPNPGGSADDAPHGAPSGPG